MCLALAATMLVSGVIGTARRRHRITSWTSLPTPPGLGGFSRVVPVAEDDVWATTGTVAFHWDGAAWTAVPLPDD
ncbi:hypothetical protein GCM10009546_12410 [Actinomadura livida]|nr:hypothetical protein GCM10010208_22680 [Actinomadura livida]